MPRAAQTAPPPGLYKHFKGGHYNGLGLSVDVTDGDPFKLNLHGDIRERIIMPYQPLHGEEIYKLRYRLSFNFLEWVERPELNYSGTRFVKIRDFIQPNLFSEEFFPIYSVELRAT